MWGLTWDELVASMPESVSHFLLPWEWSRERLWALDLPVEVVPVSRLAHVFELPFWRGEDGAPFATRPCDVLASPEDHPTQFARVMETDLSFPIHITRAAVGWMVLDGMHRLAKAALLGYDRISAQDVPPGLFAAFALTEPAESAVSKYATG